MIHFWIISQGRQEHLLFARVQLQCFPKNAVTCGVILYTMRFTRFLPLGAHGLEPGILALCLVDTILEEGPHFPHQRAWESRRGTTQWAVNQENGAL